MHKHLDETNMEQYGPHWIPAIPLPYRHSSIRKAMSFKTHHVYVCYCQARFSNEAAYREHYRTEQMLEMNQKMAKNRDMAKIKATYWRRRAFVFQYGDAAAAMEMSLIETPELHNQEEIMALLARVTDVWAPVYRKWAEENDVTVGQVKDDTTVEDETPEDPAHEN